MAETDKKWLDEFAYQLRLRGADGVQTGDALAQVEAHLAESGEPAAEEFGDPASYANDLNLPDRSGGLLGVSRALVPAFCLVAGFDLVLQASLNWGSAVAITQGIALAAALYLLTVGVLVGFARQILGSRGRVLVIVWFVAGFAAVVASAVALRTPLVHLAPPVALGIGVLLLAAAWLLRGMVGRDPIVDPRRR